MNDRHGGKKKSALTEPARGRAKDERLPRWLRPSLPPTVYDQPGSRQQGQLRTCVYLQQPNKGTDRVMGGMSLILCERGQTKVRTESCQWAWGTRPELGSMGSRAKAARVPLLYVGHRFFCPGDKIVQGDGSRLILGGCQGEGLDRRLLLPQRHLSTRCRTTIPPSPKPNASPSRPSSY